MSWIYSNEIWYPFHLYIYIYFIVYTSARGPLDYCNGVESPALQIPINQNVNFVYDPNFYESSMNYSIASSSGTNRSKAFLFDLNQLPSDEEE